MRLCLTAWYSSELQHILPRDTAARDAPIIHSMSQQFQVSGSTLPSVLMSSTNWSSERRLLEFPKFRASTTTAEHTCFKVGWLTSCHSHFRGFWVGMLLATLANLCLSCHRFFNPEKYFTNLNRVLAIEILDTDVIYCKGINKYPNQPRCKDVETSVWNASSPAVGNELERPKLNLPREKGSTKRGVRQ